MSTGLELDFGEKAIKGSFMIPFCSGYLCSEASILRGTLKEQFSTTSCPFAQSKNIQFIRAGKLVFKASISGSTERYSNCCFYSKISAVKTNSDVERTENEK